MLPRGLVTAVLALDIVNDRGAIFAFLPAMAFTVVMVTNLFIVWGSVRASRHAAVAQAKLEPSALAASASGGSEELDIAGAGLGDA